MSSSSADCDRGNEQNLPHGMVPHQGILDEGQNGGHDDDQERPDIDRRGGGEKQANAARETGQNAESEEDRTNHAKRYGDVQVIVVKVEDAADDAQYLEHLRRHVSPIRLIAEA